MYTKTDTKILLKETITIKIQATPGLADWITGVQEGKRLTQGHSDLSILVLF